MNTEFHTPIEWCMLMYTTKLGWKALMTYIRNKNPNFSVTTEPNRQNADILLWFYKILKHIQVNSKVIDAESMTGIFRDNQYNEKKKTRVGILLCIQTSKVK